MFNYVLIAVGLLIVAASFLLSEKLDEKLGSKEPAPQPQGKDLWTEKDEKAVSERIEAILAEKSEEAVVRADDQLSQISNEKIMAVSEFSDQILEKLEQNHSEIIFLYNMLGEKEDEVKRLVNTPVKPEPVSVEEKEEAEEKSKPEQKKAAAPVKKAVKKDASRPESAPAKKKSPAEKKKTVLAEESGHTVETAEGNQNERILKLYKEGKSVIEISRELSLGQGEVKLVIDLFQG